MAKGDHLFKPGNQVGKGNSGPTRDLITQQLVSQLNEAQKKGQRRKIEKLVEKAIDLATGYEYEVEKDDGSGGKRTVVVQPSLSAIEFIWNRVEGMPVQRMGNPDGSAFAPGARPMVVVSFAGVGPADLQPGDGATVVDAEDVSKK